jgi:hypothetical protein
MIDLFYLWLVGSPFFVPTARLDREGQGLCDGWYLRVGVCQFFTRTISEESSEAKKMK